MGVKRVVEEEKGREKERVEVDAGHDHIGAGAREGARESEERQEDREQEQKSPRNQENKRERRGQAAPFIVGQVYLAVAR